MKLIQAIVSGDGAVENFDGIDLEIGPPLHVALGASGFGTRVARIYVGSKFAESLGIASPCLKEGDATVGKCPDCGVEITEKIITKEPDGQTEIGSGVLIDTYKQVAKHLPMLSYSPLKSAAAIVAKGEKRTLMLVEERVKDDKYVGMFIRTTPHPYVWVNFPENTLNYRRDEFAKRAFGWNTVFSGNEGEIKQLVYDRFLILRRGDVVQTTWTTNLKSVKPVNHYFKVGADLCLEPAEARDWTAQLERLARAEAPRKVEVPTTLDRIKSLGLPWGPQYVNLWLNKIREIKDGAKSAENNTLVIAMYEELIKMSPRGRALEISEQLDNYKNSSKVEEPVAKGTDEVSEGNEESLEVEANIEPPQEQAQVQPQPKPESGDAHSWMFH